MNLVKAPLLAAALGAIALFAVVAVAFTSTDKAEPAEADCFDVVCLVEFLTADPCEPTQLGATFFNTCCDTGEIQSAFLLPCCDENFDQEPLAAFVSIGCDCEEDVPELDPESTIAIVESNPIQDILTNLFYRGVLTLLHRCVPVDTTPSAS